MKNKQKSWYLKNWGGGGTEIRQLDEENVPKPKNNKLGWERINYKETKSTKLTQKQ